MFNPESLIATIAWLGGACFCGFLPLCFAALLYFSARKRGQVGSAVRGARNISVAGLRPGANLVRLQGRIAVHANALDGAPENALVYLRLRIEVYESDGETSGWRGLKTQARGVPFQLDDGSGMVWVKPEGLDTQLLGNGVTPTLEQAEAACILLGIPLNILRGELRFTLWELRAGQTLTVVGTPIQGLNGLEMMKTSGQTFVVSPLAGQVVEGNITTQTRIAQVWMLILGIPGAIFLLCGVAGAVISLVNMLMVN